MFSSVSFNQVSFNPVSFKYDTIVPVSGGMGYMLLRRRRRY